MNLFPLFCMYNFWNNFLKAKMWWTLLPRAIEKILFFFFFLFPVLTPFLYFHFLVFPHNLTTTTKDRTKYWCSWVFKYTNFSDDDSFRQVYKIFIFLLSTNVWYWLGWISSVYLLSFKYSFSQKKGVVK